MEPPCVTDRTSLVGLKALRTRRPGDWHAVSLDGALPRWEPLAEGASVAEVLRSGAVESLAPRSAGDFNRVWRARASATRLVRALGDQPMREVDDAFVERIRIELTDPVRALLGQPLAASTASRTLSVLREAARAWAAAVQSPPKVDRAPGGPSRRVGGRGGRQVPSLEDIAALLEGADESLRAAIGLAVGGGLGEGEIASLRRGQLWVERRQVTLFARAPGRPRDPRLVRPAWIAPWAMDLLEASHPLLSRMSSETWLFPSLTRWDRPTTQLQPALARTCAAAFGEEGPSYTFGDLRRSWQAVCRAHGMPRVVVRQSWWAWAGGPGSRPAIPKGARALQRLMLDWEALGDAIGEALVDPVPVPRQAPKGTAPWAPEPLCAPRPAELPLSCRL